MRTEFRVAAVLWGAVVTASCSSGQVLGLYSFDNSSATDISGNGLTTAFSNSLTFTANGYEGGAAVFNGLDTFIRIDDLNINPSSHPQLTMGCWVRLNSNTNNPPRTFISNDNGGFDRSLVLDTRGGVNGYSAFIGTGVLGGTAAIAEHWTFLAVVYDQVAGTATLHVDGQSFTSSSTVGSGWGFVYIGVSPSFNGWFSGQIDNVFFIGRALTPGEITTIREGGINAIPTPGAGAMLLLGGLLSAKRRRR